MRKVTQEMRKTTPRVAILYPASVPWIAKCLDGVRRYAREQGGWQLFSSPPTLSGAEESALTLRSMRGWKGDAILSAFNDEAELRAARRCGIPVVNLGAGLKNSFGVPRVLVNHFQAGRLAAEHLLSRGLSDLAFFGWADLWYSDQRRLGFCERAAEAGMECDSLLLSSREDRHLTWTQRSSTLRRWLARLPRPCGVFAVHDYRAQFLMEACQEAGLHIPGEIAVIGMDNDETVCDHTAPTLTSVSRNSEHVGWEAAALLDRLMNGKPSPASDVLIEPDGVIARQSTNMLYCADPVVQHALDYMRQHLKTQFNITALAQHASVSKRSLETRFRESLGTSPHDYLTRLRIQRAQTLLHQPGKRTVSQIARESGFATEATFHAAFRRTTGATPAGYRKQKSDL